MWFLIKKMGVNEKGDDEIIIDICIILDIKEL